MIQDKLKVNDGKFELLIIGSKQQLQKLNPCHARVGNADVLPVPIARDLAVWLDSNLSMSCQITTTCGAAPFCWLHSIKRISKSLSRENLSTHLTVIHAFVTSRLDYCNGLLYGLPNTAGID